jgi:hypothetical protein
MTVGEREQSRRVTRAGPIQAIWTCPACERAPQKPGRERRTRLSAAIGILPSGSGRLRHDESKTGSRAGAQKWTQLDSKREALMGSGSKSLKNLVGLPGFEPGTSCTPSKRASQAALQPESPSLHPSHALPPDRHRLSDNLMQCESREPPSLSRWPRSSSPSWPPPNPRFTSTMATA